MSSQVVCPYCFEAFLAQGIAFRCIRPAGCAPEPDEPLARYRGLSTAEALPRVFKLPTSSLQAPTQAVCQCGMRTTKTVCPHCHNELPSQYSATEPITLALIGAKEAGKSHYIAVLIHEIMNNLGARFNASLNALDDRTIRRYKQDFARYVFDKRETIPATRSARAQLDVRYPLAYRLSFERRRYWGLVRDLKAAAMVFFDTAGEDLLSQDVMATETRYIANSQGLIFLLDPLQIPRVRAELGLPELPDADTLAPQEIIFRAAQLIRQCRGLSPDAKITIPVAITFSKIDAVRPLLGGDAVVNRAAAHDGYFDLTDQAEVEDLLRAQLKRWLGPSFHSTVSHNFERFAYFGISALGNSPDAGRLTHGVQAFRIEDPFLWLLYQLRLVRGKRTA